MRTVIAYVLLFAVMLPMLSPWGTIAYFHINRSYIAKVLCENRDRPKLNCNGKCYLAKKLKEQQDKRDKETTERIENMPVNQLFFMPAYRLSLAGTRVIRLRVDYYYLLPIYTTPTTDILQPPQLG
ncbi:hypothetical protein CLV98_101679 [Dyadobacter jejuensis]|uniref:Uncharacterized protein n=1 Tax=Dyadobacter jejuensis TaxID=1082580 RepID=A0A316AS35_9BACT|nr:hypothetical protein [Dyadobacter jejuensis]PWJ60495.1 hypothetical protein CLV98_101679 [Dyadobacter jejuensis]